MSAVAKISKSSSESGGGMPRKHTRPTPYTPGAQIGPTLKRQRRAPARKTPAWAALPEEILENILTLLAKDREALAVMLLGMVNRHLREEVQGNLKVWHMLYLHWRGHLSSLQSGGSGTQEGQTPLTRMIRTPHGRILKLNPSVPRSLPNFQCKPPSIGYAIPSRAHIGGLGI